MKSWLPVFILFSFFQNVSSRPINIADKRLVTPPPRIIRTCCSFGVDVKVAVVPFLRYNDITGPEYIGPHTFLGSKQEGNGIVYTQKGGFVDIGHLRDQADWTAFLYNMIRKNQEDQKNLFQIKLGYEGGPKVLKLAITPLMSSEDIMIIAGRIAYDLSVWHEIGTWNGTSLIPLLPERYSAFSIEDGYSNLLGIRLGIEALKSKSSFEDAMTREINDLLANLEVLPTKEDTYNAMMQVEGDWWSRRAKLPSMKVMKKRDFNVYPCISPTLLDGSENAETNLCLPELPTLGDPNKFYRIQIELNNKFPKKEIFGDENIKYITQKDFPTLIHYAAEQSKKFYDPLVYRPDPAKHHRKQF